MSKGEGVWWQRGIGGSGRHPGCTCPMTGSSPLCHDGDCATHDDDARESDEQESTMSNPEHSAWDVVAPDGTVLANGDEHDFGGADEAADWKRANAPGARVVGR